nr:MAG TPA: hypothetical protein [Caudoviricetes sp.]
MVSSLEGIQRKQRQKMIWDIMRSDKSLKGDL